MQNSTYYLDIKKSKNYVASLKIFQSFLQLFSEKSSEIFCEFTEKKVII